MGERILFLLSLLTTCLGCVVRDNVKPNIIFVVVDDMGINDIGYNNDYFKTPNLDELARTGVIFENNYVHPICTASRTSLMTGMYAFRSGLQLVWDDRPQYVPFTYKLLPERMKELGYDTAMVGKWHLGMCNWNCTPTYRGFDSFYGYYNGYVDYWTHKIDGFYDLRDNEAPVTDKEGVYITTLFNEKAMEVIDNHDTSKPLFMYLAHEAPHSPIQAPDEYMETCAEITGCADDSNECVHRRTFCGMVAALDDAMGQFVDKLKQKGMYDNTYIFFTSDNGGAVDHSGNNWPYRGSKGTVWEGGTRGAAFLHSPLLKKSNYKHQGLTHGVDAYATMVSLAEGDPNKYDQLDGKSQLDMWLSGGDSARDGFVYNLDVTVKFPVTPGRSAIRQGDFKLIRDDPGFKGKHDWFPAPEDTNPESRPTIDFSSMPQHQLFNIAEDPYEEHNLAEQMPDKVQELAAMLDAYKAESEDYHIPPKNPASDPANYNNFWTPGWCEV